jgi:hypothetical protein
MICTSIVIMVFSHFGTVRYRTIATENAPKQPFGQEVPKRLFDFFSPTPCDNREL